MFKKKYQDLPQDRVIFKRSSGLKHYRKRKFLLLFKKFSWPILCLAILWAIFYIFFVSSSFRISIIQIHGMESDASRVNLIHDEVSELLANCKSPGCVNWFFISKENLRADILERFPEIETVKIDKRFPDTLLLDVGKRETAGMYCGDKVKSQNKEIPINEDAVREELIREDCFYFDKNGVIFNEAPAGGGALILMVKISQKEKPKLGDTIFEPEIIEILNQIRQSLEQYSAVAVREFTINKESEIGAETTNGFMIYFSMQNDISLQIISLNEVLKNMSDDEKEKLDYLDLRVKGRVYYK